MKLLFCETCWDIFKLEFELRSCKCGKCKGRYYTDGHRAVTNGKGMCVALSNPTVIDAWCILTESKADIVDIKCWARPPAGEFNPNTEIREDL